VIIEKYNLTLSIVSRVFNMRESLLQVNFHHTPDYLKESGEEMSNIPECLGGTLDLEKHIEVCTIHRIIFSSPWHHVLFVL